MEELLSEFSAGNLIFTLKINSIRRFYKVFIILYALFLMYLMLVGFGRVTAEIRPIQLIPFETISKFFTKDVSFYDFFINIICNIFLFVPFGFLGLIFKSLNSIKIILPVFIIAIMVMEFLQTISGRGYGEVDDVILNTTGMLIGFILMKYFLKNNSPQILKESEI